MLAQTGCLIGHGCSPKYKIKTKKKCQATTFFAKVEKNSVKSIFSNLTDWART